jgi:transposase
MLDLPGITVKGVSFERPLTAVVEVRLRRRQLECPHCGYRTRWRRDTRPVASTWRHLDAGRWKVELRAGLRRLDCPEHGVVTEAVPFARHRAGFTRDLEDVAAFLATKTDKTTIARLLRVDWDTVGRICERVAGDRLDEQRLDELVAIGVDEVSWRKHHNYLTLVYDHAAGKVVWGAPGRDTATVEQFFCQLGERASALEAVSMDMGPAYVKGVRAHAPQAAICIDPFHAVKVVTEALNKLRRQVWNDMRREGNSQAAKKFKGARWALLKNPQDLTDEQAATLRRLKRRGGQLWRGYTLKEAFRAIFAGDLTAEQAAELIDRWLSRASRSRIDAFVKAARNIRRHRDGILAAIRLGINNEWASHCTSC